MKQCKLFILMFIALQTSLQAAMTTHVQEEAVQTYCTLIVLQTEALKKTDCLRKDAVQTALFDAKIPELDFCTELSQHCFSIARAYAPNMIGALLKRLQNINKKLTPKEQTRVYQKVFAERALMQTYVEQNNPSAFQLCDSQAKPWQKFCDEYLETFHTEYKPTSQLCDDAQTEHGASDNSDTGHNTQLAPQSFLNKILGFFSL